MSKNNNVVKVSNLNKTFMSKNGVVKAIDDVSFSIKEGEIVGLIGESGSGKTTIGRTLLRLHIPDSGSIQIADNEYATKKISKKNNRKLRNNAQMIFQDPYSSLNGQKNILNIVSEPLIVNKTDKEMVKSYLKERSEMLVFFKHALNSFYWEKEWKDRIDCLEQKITLIEKNIEEMNNMDLDKNDPKVALYRLLINYYYKDKIDLNATLVSKASDDLEEYLDKWNELKGNLASEMIDDWDEKALLKAQKDFEKAQDALKGSKATHALREKKLEIQKVINGIEETLSEMNEISNNSFEALINKIKQENKECKINLPLAKTYSEQNFITLTIVKNKIILDKVAKAQQDYGTILLKMSPSELAESLSETVTDLYGEIFNKYKEESSDASIPVKKFSELHEELAAVEWSEKCKFETLISECSVEDINFTNDKKAQIANLEEQKNIVTQKIEELTIKDAERDQEGLRKNLSDAKLALVEAKKVNEDERKKYAIEYQEKFIQLKKEKEKEINELLYKLHNIEAKSLEVYKIKMKEIEEFETKYLMEENEVDVSWKLLNETVRASLKDKKIKNEALKGEWKRLVDNKKIIRQLYGIDNAVALPYSLRKFLIKMEVFTTLKYAGLQPSHAFRYPHEFSGGMRQRVGIARAIINKPKFIIADEPIAALDLSIQAQVVNMLLEQKERLGLAMLFIAHDLSMVRFNSDRILIMHLGKLVEYGETEEIFTNPKHPYTKNLIETMPSLDNLSQGFQDSTFIANYLEPYSLTNKPVYVQVGNDDHFVLADATQADEWVGKGARRATEVEKEVKDETSFEEEIEKIMNLHEQEHKETKTEETKTEETKAEETKTEETKTEETKVAKAKTKKPSSEKEGTSEATTNNSKELEDEIVEAESKVDGEISPAVNKITKIPKKYQPAPTQKRERRITGSGTNRSNTVSSKQETNSTAPKKSTTKKSNPKKPAAKKATPKKVEIIEEKTTSPVASGRRLKDKYKPVDSRRGGKKKLRTGKFILK